MNPWTKGRFASNRPEMNANLLLPVTAGKEPVAKRWPAIIWLFLMTLPLCAQDNSGGVISGNLQAAGNFFIRDSLIGAANTPQYDRQLYGAEAWLNLTYSNWGFDFGLRFDMFHNSNLLNPAGSFTDQGIGRWYIKKDIDKLNIAVGYLYDQIGSGIIFRAYEERALLIDNALFGARLTYDLFPQWRVKVFSGLQKQQFDLYDPVIKGFQAEGFLSFGPEERPVSLAPGFGVVNRTFDDATMNNLVATINTYSKADAFVPNYNTYAFTVYNTLAAGPFTWYLEGAYKSADPMNNPFSEIEVDSTTITGDQFFKSPGSVFYTSLSFASGGWGASLEGKRTEDFSFRTRPQAQLNRGLISFLPPMSRINTYRLTTRYVPATQELGEWAWQGDVHYSPNKKWSFNINFSNITDLSDQLLYREVYTMAQYKHKRTWTLIGGLQRQQYNQEVYEFKPGVPLVETWTPYLDFLYRFDRKKSVRLEAQYMKVGRDEKASALQDYGNWLFGLVEFGIAPHWTISASDMYNVTPGKNSPVDENENKLSVHFPRVDVFYTHRSNRFSLSYVKQVEGVVCTGGICRLEPAFSGVKLTVTSNF
jgi:hypothetical protein